MKEIALVGMGGFVGSVLRYGVGLFAVRHLSAYLPMGTLLVNLVGSLLIGLLAGYFMKHVSPNYYLLLVTGLCGGFTTFSTFSIDNLKLLKEELYVQFAIYGLVSVLGGILLCGIGFWLSDRYLS